NPNSTYIFNGSSAQSTGTLFPGTVNGLTINNAAGVTLTNSTNVTGALTLTSGQLNLGSSNLTVSSVVNNTTTKYVVTSGTGALKINNIGAGNNLFPVGPSTTEYNPVTLNNAGTVDNFSVKVQDNFDFTPPTTNVVNKQWN